MALSKLDQLKEITTVVADTGDIDAIRQYQPIDATTNPSLLLKAAQLPQYQPLLQESIAAAEKDNNGNFLAYCMDELAVKIGCEILQVVPGVFPLKLMHVYLLIHELPLSVANTW